MTEEESKAFEVYKKRAELAEAQVALLKKEIECWRCLRQIETREHIRFARRANAFILLLCLVNVIHCFVHILFNR